MFFLFFSLVFLLVMVVFLTSGVIDDEENSEAQFNSVAIRKNTPRQNDSLIPTKTLTQIITTAKMFCFFKQQNKGGLCIKCRRKSNK